VAKASLVLAAIVDLAIAALLIGISGFMFGHGPQSMHAGPLFAAAYIAAVAACVAAPVAGFILNAKAKRQAAQAVAWLPVAVAVIVLVVPAL